MLMIYNMLILFISEYIPQLLFIFPKNRLQEVYDKYKFVVNRHDRYSDAIYNLWDYLEDI